MLSAVGGLAINVNAAPEESYDADDQVREERAHTSELPLVLTRVFRFSSGEIWRSMPRGLRCVTNQKAFPSCVCWLRVVSPPSLTLI